MINSDSNPVPVSSSTVVSTVPIGAIAPVFRSGDAYKAVGEVVSRSAFPALSAAFPRNGAFFNFTRTMPLLFWTGMAFGNGAFVAISGTVGHESSQIAVSYDGNTWVNASLPSAAATTGNSNLSIAFGNGQFVVVGNQGTSVFTSPDGFNWTTRTVPSARYDKVFFGNGLFIAVTSGSASAITSPDGITWTARTLPSASDWKSISYGNGVYVITSGTQAVPSNVSATSSNGITWTARTMPASAGWYSIAFGNGLFVAVGSNGNAIVAASADGITWTFLNSSGMFGPSLSGITTIRSVAFGNGVFVVAIDSFGGPATGVSYDGTTWIPKPAAGFTRRNMIYGNGMFLSYLDTIGTAATNSDVIYTENLTDSDLMYLAGTAGQFIRVK